jgi:agmatinase
MIERPSWGGLAVAPSQPHRVTILGLPYDGSACWRAGAALGPRRLREISATSPAVSELGHLVEPERLGVLDLGDLEPLEPSTSETAEVARRRYLDRVEERAAAIWREARDAGREVFPISIGGDHSVTIPLLRAFAAQAGAPFGLVSLDAHPDLFDSYDGSRLSAGCPLRRALETGLRPEHLLILGTRSYNREELAFMQEHGIRFVPAREIDRGGFENAVALARERLAGLESVYLTIDIDVADPSHAPGTGAPVAGGLSGRQTLELARGLVAEMPVRAMDLVEIAPALDPTAATLLLGLQILFETFAVLDRRSLTPAP